MASKSTSSARRPRDTLISKEVESSCPTKIFYILGLAAVIAEVALGILHFQYGYFPNHTLLMDTVLGGGGGLLVGGAIAIIYQWNQSLKIIPLEQMLKSSPELELSSSKLVAENREEHPLGLRYQASSVALIALLVITAVGLIYFLQVWKWSPPDLLQSRVAFELAGVGGIALGIPLYHYAIYPLLKCLNK